MSQQIDRKERVKYLINRLALEMFPPQGLLKNLADDIGVHPATISLWLSAGSVPAPKARYMQRRYGLDLAPAHELCREITAPEVLN